MKKLFKINLCGCHKCECAKMKFLKYLNFYYVTKGTIIAIFTIPRKARLVINLHGIWLRVVKCMQ